MKKVLGWILLIPLVLLICLGILSPIINGLITHNWKPLYEIYGILLFFIMTDMGLSLVSHE